MSKVFEALLRQQQSEQNAEQNGQAARDPLAEETGSPDRLAENGNSHFDQTNFELPSVIGAPIGPRSNEGALFSVNHHSTNDASTVPTPNSVAENGNSARQSSPVASAKTESTNGKAAVETSRPVSPALVDSRGVAERLKKSPPVIRQTPAEPEISNPKSQISNPEPKDEIPNSQLPTPELEKRQHEVPVEPILQSRLHPRLILLTDPQAPECEQYRTLRTQLFHAAEKKKTQVVTITSTLAGEGKTSTTINLGLAIAQSKEKRVLIIDGDLRRPNVAAYLGTRAKAGFGEALSGEGNPLDLLFTIEGHELYLLAVSRESSNPTELLSSERLAEMISELRNYFDFILIDSPPVLPFADAQLLVNHADAVMLVVRAGMAQYDTVEKAIESLPASKMLGVILNDAELTEEAGYYDYYYNYTQQDRRRSWWQKLLRPIRNTNLGRKLKL